MSAAAEAVGLPAEAATRPPRRRRRPGTWLRRVLIGGALLYLVVFLALPLAIVFGQALAKGFGPYFEALADPMALAAIRLTLTVAAIAVPLNLVFGVAAAWAIAKHDFRFKSALITLIDLPFSVSPGG